MEAATSVQLNIPEQESNIYLLPSGVYRDRRRFALPVSALFIAGEINSYSGKESSWGISECRRTHAKFCRDLGLSLSTVYRSLKKLASSKIIEKTSQSGYVFKKAPSQTYLRIEAYILKTEFDFAGKLRRLTPSEALVFAYFYTRCNNAGAKTSELQRTTTEIAGELGLSKKATQLALNALLSAKFIYRKQKGRNLHKKSVYGLDSAFKKRLRAYNRQQAKAAQKAKKAEEQASEAQQREAWLAQNREAALALAERNEKYMLKDYDFRTATLELKSMGFDLAMAELHGSANLIDLQQRQAELQAQRQAALFKHKLTELDLEPRYTCTECNDTGFNASDGKRCGCFERWKHKES